MFEIDEPAVFGMADHTSFKYLIYKGKIDCS
jgi:hypothetical protein